MNELVHALDRINGTVLVATKTADAELMDLYKDLPFNRKAYEEDYQLLREHLYKRVVKPLKRHSNIFPYQCECKTLIDSTMKFCCGCGVKLDWNYGRNI